MVRSAVILLRDYVNWVRRLPQATEFMFAARSPLGRSAKIFLFGVGVVLPLGSLIWVVLLWHGTGIGRYGRSGTTNSQEIVPARHLSSPPRTEGEAQ